MASGAEVTQTLESSASTYTGGIEARTIGANTPEVFFSAVTNKKPAVVAGARRAGLTAVDSFISLLNPAYISILSDLGNSIHVAFHARFSSSGVSCQMRFALYDEANALIGITRPYTFSALDFTYGTLYVSEIEIADLHSAAKYCPILTTAPTSGTVSIFVEHL